MATTVMASSASKILSAKTALSPPPKHPHRPLPVTCTAGGGKDERRPPLLRLVLAASPLAAAALAAASPLPALAEQIEKAALFDFDLTLPAIAAEFLLLMVALDKAYFTPLGKFMDSRDAEIRAGLAGVKDTSGEVKQLEEQGAAVMKAARAEISAALNQMKREMTVELEAQLAVGRKRVEAELAEALQSLEKQKEDTIKSLDSQIAALGDEIVKKVLPTA